MPDIQPIHIGLLILIIFGAAAWYGFRKNADGDREAMKTAGKMNDKPTQEPAPVPNAVLNDEPEAPTLKADDQASDIKPVAEVEIKPIVVQPPVEDEPALNDDFEVDFAKMGRRNTDVDPAVEAVAYFTPKPGLSFPMAQLTRLGRMVEDNGLSGLVRFDFFDQDAQLWHHDLDNVQTCTQIYMATLLANRARSIARGAFARAAPLPPGRGAAPLCRARRTRPLPCTRPPRATPSPHATIPRSFCLARAGLFLRFFAPRSGYPQSFPHFHNALSTNEHNILWRRQKFFYKI